jgi:hypothetical protein
MWSTGSRQPLANKGKSGTLKGPASGVLMKRLKRLEPYFLVSLALGPFGFLALVSSAKRGRDLTAVFFTGVALFLVVAILLAVIGFWKGRPEWKMSGIALFLSLVAVTFCSAEETGGYYLWRHTLKVDADHYQGISEKLDTFTGRTWPLYGAPIPVVEVNLKKNPD